MANQATNNNIDAILADYMRRTDAGEAIDRDEFVAAHPQVANELLEYFASVDDVERMAGPPLASTVKNGEKAAETHMTGVGDSVSEKPARRTRPGNASKNDSLPETFGRYRIEKQLGRGAMGAVYLAHDTQLDRRVALKTPTFDTNADADMVERFYREARAAANLRHAGICPIFDVGEIDGTHYISMAYIAGKPLSDLIDVDKKLPIRSVVSLVRKIALALDHAHNRGVIHRDLKPANIMIDKQKQPLIMDFGLARRVDQHEQTRLTQDGMILGTPAYMSPEQVEGNLESGKQSDVYSLGVILYELLTGDLPFQGTIAAVIGQIMTQDAPPPSGERPEVDAALDSICKTMMARKLENRYAGMKEAAEALTDYLKGKASKPQQPSGAPPKADASVSPKTATEDQDLTAFLAKSPVDNSIVAPARHRGIISQNLKPWKNLPLGTKTIATSVLAGALLVMMGVVLFIQTDKGWVKIEILDSSLTVSVDKKSITVDNDGKQLQLDVGPHKLFVNYEGLEFPAEEPFEIKKNNTVALRVTRVGEKIVVLREGDELEKPKETKNHDSTSPTGFTWEDLTAFPAAQEGFSENVRHEGTYVNGKHVVGNKRMPLKQRVRVRDHPLNGKWIFASSFESPNPGNAERPSEILYQFETPVTGLRMTAVCANPDKNAAGHLKVYADRKLVDERRITTKSDTFEIRFDGAKTLSLQATATSIVGGHWILYLNPEVLVSANESPTGRSLTPTEILTSPDWEWSEPEAIVEVNSEENESAVTVSGDGLQMLISRGEDIFGSDRDSTTAPWGQPKTLKWPKGYKLPSLSGDGCTAVVGASGSNLAIMTRPSRDAPWGAPVKLGKQINTSYHQSYPSLSDDGLTLIYSLHWPRGAPDGKPRADLRVSRRESLDSPWSEPEDLGPLINTAGAQKTSCLSSDGRVLLFSQSGPGGWGTDYFMATRDSLTAAWNHPVRLPNIFQTKGDDNSIDLSSDGREVYISKGGDIYVVRRVPKAGLPPATITAADDWVDLLALTTNKTIGKRTTWRIKDGQLVGWGSNRFPIQVEGSFEYKIEFTTEAGTGWVRFGIPDSHGRPLVEVTARAKLMQAHAMRRLKAAKNVSPDEKHTMQLSRVTNQDTTTINITMDGKPWANWTGKTESLAHPDGKGNLFLSFDSSLRRKTTIHAARLRMTDGKATLGVTSAFAGTAGDSVADSWVNIVPLIEPKSDVLSGKLVLLDEGFRLERDGSSEFAQLRLPVTPEGHYRLRLDVTQVQPTEFSIFLPVQSNGFALRLANSQINLEQIDKKGHANVPADAQARVSRLNKRYQVVVEVRPFNDHVQIVVEKDGKEVLNWTGTQDRISMPSSWPDKSCGLQTWGRQQTTYDIHSCELQILDGEAKPTVAADTKPAPKPPTQPTPVVATDGWTNLFNGKDLTGWEQMRTSGRQDDVHRPTTGDWVVQDGQIICNTSSSGWLKSSRQFDNFELELEFKLSQLGNSGVYVRSSGSGRLSRTGVEAQVIDDTAAKFKLTSKNRSGAIHNVIGPSTSALRPIGEWNEMSIRCEGELIKVTLNGVVSAERNMAEDSLLRDRPRSGHLGLANWHGEGMGTAFRNIRIRELEKTADTRGPVTPKPQTKTDQELKKLEEAIFPWLVWVQAEGDKRKPLAVATARGLCCVYPGGFKSVEISSLDEMQKVAGTVGSRSPFPFCWIDPATPKANGIALAGAGAHRIAQPGLIVMRTNGKPELQIGQVNADGTFTPEKPYNPPNRGVTAPGPIFNANGECLGYGVRSKRGSPIKIYPLRRE